MIEALRMLISSSMSFDGVKIFNASEQSSLGVPSLFAKQLYMEDSLGHRYIFSAGFVTNIEWKFMQPPVSDCIKIERLTAAGEITYEPVWVLPQDKHAKHGIPNILDEEQLIFFSLDRVFITPMDNTPLIQL